MTQNKNQSILYTEMRVIYMAMQCLSLLQQATSNG